MGLFDTVKCEYPLPIAAHQDREYQTKDLGSLLDRYTITRNGQLIRHRRPGARGLNRDIEWPIHGDIRIYDYDQATKEFIEYTVRFTHGRVEWIRRVGERDAALPDEREARPSEPTAPLGLVPELWGRRLTVEEFTEHAPEKLELIDGEIPGSDKLLLVLLTSMGLRRAAMLVGPDRWRMALVEDESAET